MFRGRWIGLLMAVFALAGLLATGCSNDTSRPSDRTGTQDVNINDAVGGFTSQNELPAFGDAALQASGAAEDAQDDPMNQNPDVQALQHADSTHVYVVTMLWGMFSGDPAVGTGETPGGDQTDWSGYLKVNRGAVLLASTIAFERNDEILGRTDPQMIAWVSHTTTSFDGIRVVVYQPFENGQDGSTDSMTVVAGPHNWKFLVNDLKNMDYTEVVDANGNKFTIRSMAVSPRLTSRGFLGGAWLAPADPSDMGTFRGRWISRSGRLAGYVKGYFGTNSAGEKVFFGKYIDENGLFRGFIRGQWDESGPDLDPRVPRTYGWFRGDWLDASKTRIGTLRGQWRSSRGGTDGFFEGVWFTGIAP